VASFFEKAKELGIDVQIGYGEDTGEKGKRYNTAVYVSGKSGEVLNKYRKVGP
jgi:predicted amidohydrolase